MTPMSDPTDDDTEADDLHWLAFRYVADELDEPERSAFEARLASEPDACEAVAEAVELAGACLRIVEADRPEPACRPRRSRAAFPLTTAAAAAILLATFSIVPSGPRGADGGELIALERAWSGLQRDAIAEVIDDIAPEPFGWSAELLGDGSPAIDDEEFGPGPPSWLLAAVELSGDRDAPESDPRPMEN